MPHESGRKVAIYARTTCENDVETAKRQVEEMKAYCGAHDWEVVRVYRDGRPASKLPGELKTLINDLEKSEYNFILFGSLIEFAPCGICGIRYILGLLSDSGIGWRSHSEPIFDSDERGSIVLSILDVLLEHEPKRRRDNAYRGLTDSRKKPGAKRKAFPGGEGYGHFSVEEIMARLNCSRATAYRRRHEETMRKHQLWLQEKRTGALT